MKHGSSGLPVVLSCEHATARIPPEYEPLFEKNKDILSTHRAYDSGAYDVARILAEFLNVELFQGEVSRLLIDLNRKSSSKTLFSEFSTNLSPEEKDELISRYHEPYHSALLKKILTVKELHGRVFHFSVHSFTPVLSGEERNCDLGILYDPSCTQERKWVERLTEEFKRAPFLSGLHVRRNYPYRGISDGICTWIRSSVRDHYFGIEIEINQRLVGREGFPDPFARELGEILRRLTTSPDFPGMSQNLS